MPTRYLPFVDWMKAVGMAAIVWGHVAAGTTPGLTPPFNLKQLGVALFVFITGVTLARERRPALHVVVGRSVEIFTWALLGAVLWSGVALGRRGDLNLSNFLPLAGGLHVLEDAFPANPTTWYVGTYLHLLLLWAFVLRGRSITLGRLLAWLPAEVAIRAAVMIGCGLFIGYMQLANWVGVLLLGLSVGGRDPGVLPRGATPGAALFVVAWPLLLYPLAWDDAFPFQTSAAVPSALRAVVTSAAVSVAYLGYTLAAYAILARLAPTRVVQFLARNTLVVFIAHMPAYYVLEALLLTRVPSYAWRVTIEFVLCYAVLAIVAEGMRRWFDPRRWRDRVVAFVAGPPPAEPAPDATR